MDKILNRGAEAVLSLNNNILTKDRLRKGYRIKEIDVPLRKKRTRDEESLLKRAKNIGINVPQIFKKSDFVIEMEYINGKTLKDELSEMDEKNILSIFKQISKMISELHKADIIHGDLTTSNMLCKDGDIYFIDFGLGFMSKKVEDKAVDLYLLKKALLSKHFKVGEKAFSVVLKNYKDKEVIKRLEKVESRGRYRKK